MVERTGCQSEENDQYDIRPKVFRYVPIAILTRNTTAVFLSFRESKGKQGKSRSEVRGSEEQKQEKYYVAQL